MIVINDVSFATTATASNIFNHRVESLDSVVLILSGVNVFNVTPTVFYNGTPVPQVGISAQDLTVTAHLLLNPPVGAGVIEVDFATAGNIATIAYTLTGVDKSITNPLVLATGSFSGTTPVATIQIPFSDGIIFDFMEQNQTTVAVVANSGQTQTFRTSQSIENPIGSYKRVSQGVQTMKYTAAFAPVGDWLLVALKAADAASIYHPVVWERNFDEVIRTSGVDANSPASFTLGYRQTPFFHNSFFQTIGRSIPNTTGVVNPAGELERPFSQILIDKVAQGQVAGNGITAGTLNLQVPIPTQDSVLIVTGGSVIATGAAWASVTLNGTPLTRLAQAITVGADAEIWWMPNPPVGVYTLSIVGGNTTAEVYANAMVLQGVDYKDTNIITASATDAASTSTITANITPDVQNALLIDVLSTLDATALPVADNSQNQVFNATAINNSEAVISTYKVAGLSPQTMSYNLSAAVNASLVVAAFRPSNSPSLWRPNIGLRNLNDVVDTAGLDAGLNPPTGNYGYLPSNYYLNSFLHTIGRYPRPSTQQTGSTLLLMGVG